MQINISPEVIQDLREILLALEQATEQHTGLPESEELIEPWKPSGSDDDIQCPDLTVGLVRKASRVRKILRL